MTAKIIYTKYYDKQNRFMQDMRNKDEMSKE